MSNKKILWIRFLISSVNLRNTFEYYLKTSMLNKLQNKCQSDKNDSEWYLKSSKQSLHVTQVKRHVDLSYFKSDSEESYEIIKFLTTEKKLRENYYFNDDSYEDFSQEEL